MQIPLKTGFVVSLAIAVLLSGITAALSPLLQRFYPLLPDKGAAWYFWQLPEASAQARISFWTLYVLHQITVWILLWRVIRSDRFEKRTYLNRNNIIVLAVNLLFVILHLIQTHIWYDGLAQDVPIWTSQGSVIVMLVLILFLEMPRRGLFWGKFRRVPQRTYALTRKWHGLYISWALLYTFWFHPMEGNWGLLSGFIYMFLLFIQLSLFNTAVHYDRTWIVVLEVFVAIHAALITVYKANPIWPMFMFGFLVMFFLTQMHTWKIRTGWKIGAVLLFLTSVILVYAYVRGFNHIYELTFIPVALYGGTIGFWLLGFSVEKLTGRKPLRPRGQ